MGEKEIELRNHYYLELDRVNSEFEPYIRRFADGHFAYGKLALQTLIALNGGAIVTMPATLSLVSSEGGAILYWAIGSLISGLVCAVTCVYFTHLNYLYLYMELEKQRNARALEIMSVFGFLEEDRKGEAKIKGRVNFNEWMIRFTFWGPHILGIASLLFFCFAGYLLVRDAMTWGK